MHDDVPHIVGVPVAADFASKDGNGATLDDLDYYLWILDYDIPSNLVVDLDKGRHPVVLPSGDTFHVLFNNQSNVFWVAHDVLKFLFVLMCSLHSWC